MYNNYLKAVYSFSGSAILLLPWNYAFSTKLTDPVRMVWNSVIYATTSMILLIYTDQ
jgi:hypothetical protein